LSSTSVCNKFQTEVSTPLLRLRVNRRHGTDGQTDGRTGCNTLSPRYNRLNVHTHGMGNILLAKTRCIPTKAPSILSHQSRPRASDMQPSLR